jgi:hypothetical protein
MLLPYLEEFVQCVKRWYPSLVQTSANPLGLVPLLKSDRQLGLHGRVFKPPLDREDPLLKCSIGILLPAGSEFEESALREINRGRFRATAQGQE